MTKLKPFDLEQLSAYLDEELDQVVRARLDARLASDPELRTALEELRRTRGLLRRTPRRRAPRNFTLTSDLAGLRPPVPRLVPMLSWASAAAMLLFLCTVATSFLPRASFGAAASKPVAAQAPVAASGAAAPGLVPPGRNAAATAPLLVEAVPAATEVPSPGTYGQAPLTVPVPEETKPSNQPTEQSIQPLTPGLVPSSNQVPVPSIVPPSFLPIPLPWIYVWLALAALLGGTAVFIRARSVRSFHRKFDRKNKS